MRLETISADDWQEFQDKYRSAYMFLLTASLRGEFRALESYGKHRNVWETERLKELSRLNTGDPEYF